MEIFLIGMFAVLACLCRLAQSPRGMPFGLPGVLARRILIGVAVAAIAASPMADAWQLRRAKFHRDQQQLVDQYLQTGDPGLIADAPESSLPYPSRERLQALLDDPDVRSVIAPR